MRGIVATLAVLPLACAQAEAPPPAAPPSPPPPAPAAVEPAPKAPEWPEVLASAMRSHGPPHAAPVALPVDARGRDRWLAFVGPPETAVSAWRVGHAQDGATTAEPVERWPAGARVLGAVTAEGATYVLLETLGALDQPAGLRGVWVESGASGATADATPLALADVKDAADLAARVAKRAPGAPERNAVSLLATLRAAAASQGALARALASGGADLGLVWQSTFVQRTGHLDGQGAGPSAVTDRALAVVRSALETQACGVDACEAWTDQGRAVVRFAVDGGRWTIRAVLEDAPAARPATGGPGKLVQRAADAASSTQVLREHAREATVLGEAPLASSGGTVGVAMTDLSPGAPVVAVREGVTSRVFVVDAAVARQAGADAKWDVAFADVDGDGRTDVVLRMQATRGGAPVAWTQAWLAPPPSVQAARVEPDLPSALAMVDAPDAQAAAQAASALPARAVGREDACRVLAAASTPAGFKKAALADARVLRFDEPLLPTWLPKVVPAARVTPDDVRGLGAHCAELSCRSGRPYCEWLGGSDSQHFWFAWRDGNLALAGAADYDGE